MALIPAVSYVRMSTDKQDASPDQQRDAIAKLAAKSGFKIVREYFDGAISGDATDRRHNFQQMIADAGKGSFRAILAWDQSRFGRFDSIEAGYWVFPLVQAGVELVTVSEGKISWTDFQGRLMFAIQAEGKHAFLRDLSKNVYRGQSAAARRGEWLGMAPMGYRKEGKRLVIDETAAETIRMMFQLCRDGHSLRAIAERLNTAGKPTANGATWQASNVAKVLRNVTYTGAFRWGVRNDSKYSEPGTRGDVVEIPHNHPAIIDPETFATIQRLLVARKRLSAPHRNGGAFILTGIIKCSRCGGGMSGRVLTDGDVRYSCWGYHARGNSHCSPNRVSQNEILEAALAAIEAQFLNPSNLDRLRAELKRQTEAATDPKLVDRLRKQLATVNAKLAKATRRLIECESDMLPTVQTAIRELRSEAEQLKTALKAAETPRKRLAAAADSRIKMATDSVSKLRQTLQGDPLKMREILREAVERIDVRSEPIGNGQRRKWQLTEGSVILRGGFVSNLSTPVRWSSGLRG